MLNCLVCDNLSVTFRLLRMTVISESAKDGDYLLVLKTADAQLVSFARYLLSKLSIFYVFDQTRMRQVLAAVPRQLFNKFSCDKRHSTENVAMCGFPEHNNDDVCR